MIGAAIVLFWLATRRPLGRLRGLVLGLLVLSMTIWLGARAVDPLFGRSVFVAVRLHAPEYRDALRASRGEGALSEQQLAEEIGILEPGGKQRVLFVRETELVPDAPVPILHVDRAAGETVLLKRTVFTVSFYANCLLLLAAAVMIFRAPRRRGPSESTPTDG